MYENMHAPANQRYVPESERHLVQHLEEKKEGGYLKTYGKELDEKIALHLAGTPPMRDVILEEQQGSRRRLSRLDAELNLIGLLGMENVYPTRHDHPGGTSGMQPRRMNDHNGGLSY